MKKDIILIILLSLPVFVSGCKGKEKESVQQNALHLQKYEEQPIAATKQHIGTKEIAGDVRSKCPQYKMITKAGTDTPEDVIFKAYQAVLTDNLPGFIACFGPHKNKIEIKRFYWKNIKKYIGDYTKSPKNASFAVCKKEEKRPDLVKIFVLSKDPRKSHPPIILKKYNGNWKISFFTP